jgi:transcription-repair coupling factor (superfamily II helicase)
MVGEAVAEYRRGGEEPEPAEVRVELPVDAHIPHDFVPSQRLRVEAYRKIAGIVAESDVDAVRDELQDRYGILPDEVESLLAVARFRAHVRAAGITEVTLQGNFVRLSPVELRESQQLRLQRLYPRSLVKPATRTILVPRPSTAPLDRTVGGQPMRGRELLDWARDLVDSVTTEGGS